MDARDRGSGDRGRVQVRHRRPRDSFGCALRADPAGEAGDGRGAAAAVLRRRGGRLLLPEARELAASLAAVPVDGGGGGGGMVFAGTDRRPCGAGDDRDHHPFHGGDAPDPAQVRRA